MSLAFRLGAAPSLSGGWMGILPRLPAISIRIPNPFQTQGSIQNDRRLQELKEQIENNNGEAPFMIDNGMILRAVPKKKPSYRRTRQKLYAPGDKQIKHLDNLGRCPACGHVKRSHFMCMHCFAEIKSFLKMKKKATQDPVEAPQANLDPIDEKIVYPGKHESEYERRLKKKDWIPVREEPLMFNAEQLKNPKK